MSIEPARPDNDGALASALIALQRRAYTIEAKLIGDDRIPALQESEADLCARKLQWLTILDNDALIGAIAWSVSDGHAVIERLIVEPAMHRRGIGCSLVTAALHGIDRRPVLVSTGAENYPARRLYESLGFEHDGDEEVTAGLWTARYVLRSSKSE